MWELKPSPFPGQRNSRCETHGVLQHQPLPLCATPAPIGVLQSPQSLLGSQSGRSIMLNTSHQRGQRQSQHRGHGITEVTALGKHLNETQQPPAGLAQQFKCMCLNQSITTKKMGLSTSSERAPITYVAS